MKGIEWLENVKEREGFEHDARVLKKLFKECLPQANVVKYLPLLFPYHFSHYYSFFLKLTSYK